MSFNIILKSGRSYEWELIQEKPDVPVTQVETFYADGLELSVIRAKIVGIPITHNSNTCTWRGEMAQFLFENL